jgi:hypothetical protein
VSLRSVLVGGSRSDREQERLSGRTNGRLDGAMHGHAERCASFAKSASRKPPPLDRSVRPPAFRGVVFRPSWDQAGVTLIEKGSSMHRGTFLLAFFGSLAAAPTIIASSSSAEAASMPKARSPVSQLNSEPVSSSGDAHRPSGKPAVHADDRARRNKLSGSKLSGNKVQGSKIRGNRPSGKPCDSPSGKLCDNPSDDIRTGSSLPAPS